VAGGDLRDSREDSQLLSHSSSSLSVSFSVSLLFPCFLLSVGVVVFASSFVGVGLCVGVGL
jgi:hypothetical protein